MIKLVGKKRAIVLGATFFLNILLATGWLFGVDPLREEASNQLNGVRSRISQLSGDIQNIKSVLAAYPDNYAKYQALEKRDFFSKQDRFEASRILDDLRARAGLIGYSYKLDSIRTIANAQADTTSSTLIDTKISLEKISSVFDSNIYGLIGSFASSFPQHARLSKFEIKKNRDVNAESLKMLTKEPVGFTDAMMELDWLTVTPKITEPPPNQAHTGGG